MRALLRSSQASLPPGAAGLRELALAMGADDAGVVSLGEPALDEQRAGILRLFPFAKSLVSFVVRMNRANIRSPARSVANLEFHHAGDECDEVARAIVRALEDKGRQAGFPSMGFPMEADNWPGKIWVISHKPIAVAAGLGHMGLHRNVIHPKFGNFILLGTVAVDVESEAPARPLETNPCLSCKLCVAACPTGAIAPDGHFDFSACYTHNYREFMGGFADWTETVAGAGNAKNYRARVRDSETVSMWQSLAFGPNYKAAYCLAVCPAGEDVIGAYRDDKKGFLETFLDPLQGKRETVYVIPGSDAESYVARRFPHKAAKRVGSGLRPTNVDNFLGFLPALFQRGQAGKLNASYHFIFTGESRRRATVVIADRKLRIIDGLAGAPDLTVTADAATWIACLRKEASLPLAMLRFKIRLRGDPRLLLAFGRCFPA
ncbi:SCP2 sterol-binding domain-containing protein [Methylocystis heyeri]|nr:SCP2 sterol-binding domain-containing protein [Methylocystis heyeri]